MYWDFGIPTRIARVSTTEEITRLVNIYNGTTDCYLSVNPYEIEGERKKVKVDRAYFDFDNDVAAVNKFVKYLTDEDIKFNINFSGRGHHVYVFCRGAGDLKTLQLTLLSKAGVVCDPHVIGDEMRISRIENTFNFKSKSFCIPIRIEEIGQENASKQRFDKIMYGNKVLDLSEYTEQKCFEIKGEVLTNLQIDTGDVPMLPCIRNIIKTVNPTHTQRYVLAVYLSDAIRRGVELQYFNRKELCDTVLTFLEKNCKHWLDWNRSKSKYWVDNIVQKFGLHVGCNFIRAKGCCTNCGV